MRHPVGRMDCARARRTRDHIDRSVAALDQANARGIRDAARGHSVCDRKIASSSASQRREPGKALRFRQRRKRNESITIPVANHIANSRQNAIPSQRCEQDDRAHHVVSALPFERRREFKGPRRAQQDLVGIERIGPDRVALVGKVAHPEGQRAWSTALNTVLGISTKA